MSQNNSHHSGSPEMLSLTGYILAKESGQIRRGIELCLKAIGSNPHIVEHYLHLGRIYLIANKKEYAIKTFKKGLRISKDARILEELNLLGTRQPPPVPGLPRNHVINRVAGKVLHALT
ncbi:MAG: tetratricopeptide repeat protein [Desulfuromonadaceae bacterium]